MNANITIKGLSIHIVEPVEGFDRDKQAHIQMDELTINLTPDTPKPQIHPMVDSLMEDLMGHLPGFLHHHHNSDDMPSHIIVGGSFGPNDLPDEIKDSMPQELKDILGIK